LNNAPPILQAWPLRQRGSPEKKKNNARR
jgi:hypothetical protein